jgi:hypothetical protein
MLSVIMLNVVLLTYVMLNVVMLTDIMLNTMVLNVVMLNVIMLNVVMLIVAMLNVVAPSKGRNLALTENIRLGWKCLSYFDKYSGLFLQIAFYNVFEKFGYLIQKISLYC